MNLLESLVARALESAAVVVPPRVPFVNAFPGPPEEPGPAVTAAIDTAAAPAPEALVPQRPVTPPRPQDVPAARVPRSRADPPVRRPSRARTERAPTTVDAGAPLETPNLVRPASARVHPPSTMPTRPAPSEGRETAPARSEAPSRPPVREIHHEHHVEHRLEHVIERVDAPRVLPPAPAPRATERRPAPPPAPPPVPTLPPRDVAIGKMAPAVEPTLPPARPEAPPPVLVSIDRVVVRVQAPADKPRSETTRPVAPALGLDAYSATRRRRPR